MHRLKQSIGIVMADIKIFNCHSNVMLTMAISLTKTMKMLSALSNHENKALSSPYFKYEKRGRYILLSVNRAK